MILFDAVLSKEDSSYDVEMSFVQKYRNYDLSEKITAKALTFRITIPIIPCQVPLGSGDPQVLSTDRMYWYLDIAK